MAQLGSARVRLGRGQGQAGQAKSLNLLVWDNGGDGHAEAPADCGRGPETFRASNECVEDADNLGEAWPLGAVFVPTIKHELVQGTGAAHGGRQAVSLLHRADDLEARAQSWLEAQPPPWPTPRPTKVLYSHPGWSCSSRAVPHRLAPPT